LKLSSFCALLFCLAPSLALPFAQASGHLVVIGGGDIPDEILSKTLSLSGGKSAKVVIFPQASELPDAGERAINLWKKAGAAQAVALTPNNADAAIKAVSEATLIWFPGGDQNRLTAAMEKTGVPEAIRNRYLGGATVAGTSAGAAVMSKIMITGDADLQSITVGATKIAPGLGLSEKIIFDQHFLKRQRQNRLIGLVLEHPDYVGIGIDEQTAVVVDGNSFEVIGKSTAVIVDARKATIENRSPGQPAAARDIRMHVLTAGMKFDLKSPKPGMR
jgi:cyanophycinase